MRLELPKKLGRPLTDREREDVAQTFETLETKFIKFRREVQAGYGVAYRPTRKPNAMLSEVQDLAGAKDRKITLIRRSDNNRSWRVGDWVQTWDSEKGEYKYTEKKDPNLGFVSWYEGKSLSIYTTSPKSEKYNGRPIINLNQAFIDLWDDPAAGSDYQAATLAHELTHAFFGTEDRVQWRDVTKEAETGNRETVLNLFMSSAYLLDGLFWSAKFPTLKQTPARVMDYVSALLNLYIKK